TIAGDGSHTRDYVHVSDVARANLVAATSKTVGKGEVINIGSGKETSVKRLSQLIGGPVEHVEPRIEPTRSIADVSKAKKLLGWEASVSREAGLSELKPLHDLA